MSDDLFGDLGDQLNESDPNGEGSSGTSASKESASDGEGPASASTEFDPTRDPAFEFSETQQGTVYPRTETWEGYDQGTRLDVTYELRQRGVLNVPTREIDDAVLRFAGENVDQLAELIAEGRDASED